ncbi:ABC transporter substrate-binding protein/permease [Mollicutes bacterium LVI A0039]|nr:ABC transporter substrate-binding protein/permease [Mollicutes bacterium LVI A0039]
MKKIITVMILMISLIGFNFNASETYTQIEDGVLTIGTDCAYAPYAFTTTEENASNTAVKIADSGAYCDGYDVMLASQIADELGVELEIKVISFDGLTPALNSGQIDMIIAGMSATPDRAKEIDFTTNYYNSEIIMSIVMGKDSPFAEAKTINDFEGAEISSQLGTFHSDLLTEVPGVTVVNAMESVDTLLQATESGTIDGYMTETDAAEAQAKSSDKLTYVDLPDLEIPAEFTGVSIGLKKGSGDFVEKLNTIINGISDETKDTMMEEAELKAEGKFVEAEDKSAETESAYPQLEDGVFTIGTDCAYAPYAFTTTEANASNTAVQIADSSAYCDGYDIMIASKIAEQLDATLEVKVISFDGLIPAVNSGQIDAIIAGMSATPDRKNELDFTSNYYDSNLLMAIVTNTNSEYADAKGKDDFIGAEISSQLGTFHGDLLPDVPGVNVVSPMESVDVLMQATKAETIDGYITEEEAAVSQAGSSEDLTYILLEDLDIDPGFSGVALGLKKGSEGLVTEIDGILTDISDAEREQLMAEANSKANGEYVEETSFLGDVWNLLVSNKALYIEGLKTTLVLALFGTVFGTLVGFVIVSLRIQEVHYKDKPVVKVLKKFANWFAIVYIDIIRGTPMMVQAMLFFYGIAANIMEPNTAGVIIISFNTAAYIAEILRSGINAIDPGQMEAGRSLGLTNNQAFVSIIVPQTLKNTLPALANELIVNIKDSSVLSVIAVSELFYATKQAASTGYQYTESYFISAAIYLVLTITLTRVLNIVMRKLLKSENTEEMMNLQNIEEAVKL